MAQDITNQELLQAINKGFNAIESRFEEMEKKMATKEEMGEQFEGIEIKMNDRFEWVDQRFGQMEAKMNERFDDIDTQLEQVAEFVKDHQQRVVDLEKGQADLKRDFATI